MNPKFSRRAVLRGTFGAGIVSVGLPFLECHLNSSGTALAATGQELPICFGTWFQALGFNPGMWEPKQTGPRFANNIQLKVLDAYRSRMNIFSGMKYYLDGRAAEGHVSGPEIAYTGDLFDGSHSGPSLDSNVADAIGKRSRFRSLEVTFDGSRNSRSQRSGSSKNPSEPSPAALYKRIFGPEFKDPNAAEFTPDHMVLARKSVLSSVTAQRTTFVSQLGASDKAKVDEYFTALREIELQLDLEMQKPLPLEGCVVPEAVEEGPVGSTTETIKTNAKLLAKLLAHALACGQTRVFNIDLGTSGWRQAGRPFTWHIRTHEESVDEKLGYQKDVFEFVTLAITILADTLAEFDAIKEGPKTLLDRCLVLWQTDHGEARTHSLENVPIMTFGSAGGHIKTGIHVATPGDPCTRVGLTVQQAMGVPLNSWGMRSNQVSKPFTEILA